MPVTTDMCKAEIRLQFETSLGKQTKKLTRPYLNEQGRTGGAHLWSQPCQKYRCEDQDLRPTLGLSRKIDPIQKNS
jgi:hypothetical protein